eukprot:s151_g16.t1
MLYFASVGHVAMPMHRCTENPMGHDSLGAPVVHGPHVLVMVISWSSLRHRRVVESRGPRSGKSVTRSSVLETLLMLGGPLS